MSWRASALAREAACNVRANSIRSFVGLAIIASSIGVLVHVELRQAREATEFLREFEAAGGYMAVVSGGEGMLDSGRCEQLRSWPGVRAAGALGTTTPVSFANAPGQLFQSAVLSPGLLRAWQPGAALPTGGGYVVGPSLGGELGLRPGSRLALAGESPATVASVLDAERRNPATVRWLLDVAAPSFAAHECWVVFDRGHYEPGLAALPAWFADGAAEPAVRPYIRRDAFTRDVSGEFASRPQRHGWVAAGGLVVAVFVLASWFRRAELGLYLALGTARLQLAALLFAEAALLLGAGFVLALSWAIVAERLAGHAVPWEHVELSVRAAGSAALLGLVAAPLLSSLVARGNLASLLKDR